MSTTSTPSKALVHVGPKKSARVAYVAKQAASAAGWQAAQAPKYTFRVALHSCRGMLFVLPAVCKFLRAEARRTARDIAVASGNQRRIEKAQSSYGYSLGFRYTLVLLPPFIAVDQLRRLAGNWGFAVFAGLLMLSFAILGSRLNGEKILDRTPPKRRDLTQERVDDALQAIKILRTPKHEYDNYGTAVQFLQLPHSIKENGISAVSCLFDLPPGCNATARDVVKKREALAAQLGVSGEQLDLRTTRGGDQQVSLWLAASDPLAGEPVESSYLTEKRTSIWEGATLGTDARGLPVTVPLIWQSVYVSGTPRRGKTSVVRLIATAGALDPYCDFMLIDFKGGKDFKGLKQLASQYVCGKSETHARAALEAMRDLDRMTSQRYEIIGELDDDICPDGKLTKELAETHNLRPVLVVIDELEVGLSAFEDNKERAEFEKLISSVARSGPAAGIIFVVASQRPDSESVPTRFRDVVSTRIAVQCVDGNSSDLVLGRGAASRGWDASRLPWSDGKEAAQCIVLSGGNGQRIKVDWIDLPEFKKLCERGYHLRSAAGTLREEEDTKPVNLLDVVIRELSKQDGQSASALCDGIRDFADLTPVALGKRLGSIGLRSQDTNDGRKYFLSSARAALG